MPDRPAGRTDRSAAPAASPRADLMELVDWCRYVVGQEPTSVTGMPKRSANS